MAMNVSLKQIAQWLKLAEPVQDVRVTGAVIDTRKIKTGDMFVALKGEHTDGHQYLAQAREAGASCALVSERQDDVLPQLLVTDVRQAFAGIAHGWLQKTQAKVVAITGSNGKTTVKEMVRAILTQVGNVTATAGNLNNDLGVPLTLCTLNENDDYAVIEMGANHHGEIATLVKIAPPDVAIINNVASAHLEGFGSEQGVAEAKGEIFAGLKADGTAVVNADMPYSDLWQNLIGARKQIHFALQNDADLKADCIQLDPAAVHFMVKIEDVCHHINVPLPGLHNIANALAAMAVTTALNIPVEAMVKGLSSMQSVPHRLQLRNGPGASKLLDDTYNANPGSYTQALNAVAGFPAEQWLVLGDFGELGADCIEIHRKMGLQAREAGIKKLLTVGEMSRYAAESFGEGAEHFADKATLQEKLEQDLSDQVICLIKGSRFMQLDKLADVLAQREAN